MVWVGPALSVLMLTSPGSDRRLGMPVPMKELWASPVVVGFIGRRVGRKQTHQHLCSHTWHMLGSQLSSQARDVHFPGTSLPC